jgi:hypothetical protein
LYLLRKRSSATFRLNERVAGIESRYEEREEIKDE